ncbi:MAG TPA: hypothetical protein VES73_08770 [Lamprocystis sp. (in: g-proteobacteria)]|nr:hypothetical protein [Lamprocystis sp. (in: g-proteobacteria)]
MILTQPEAESRGCPLRVISRRVTVAEITTFAPCLHEQCMAWRWEDGAMDSRRMPDSYFAEDLGGGPRGYCGLSGLPMRLAEPPKSIF